MWTKRFVDRLYQLRAQKGVSARDMSLSLGQAPGYINNIENGKSLPSMASFFYICDYFSITPSQFFDEDIQCPARMTEAIKLLQRLSPTEMDHILLLIQDLNARK